MKENIEAYPDFPKKGIIFQDIFGAMRKKEVLEALMSLVEDHAKSLEGKIDAIVALDARGFLFGPIMAYKLKLPFVPVRKKGKLPGECTNKSYDLEYGQATIEIQNNAFEFSDQGPDGIKRILVVDDLLATGGTLEAACNVVNKIEGCKVTHALVIMELTALKGRSKLDPEVTLTSFLKYED